jgi:hypothetical protein
MGTLNPYEELHYICFSNGRLPSDIRSLPWFVVGRGSWARRRSMTGGLLACMVLTSVVQSC